jgi:hypothetical protein
VENAGGALDCSTRSRWRSRAAGRTDMVQEYLHTVERVSRARVRATE